MGPGSKLELIDGFFKNVNNTNSSVCIHIYKLPFTRFVILKNVLFSFKKIPIHLTN